MSFTINVAFDAASLAAVARLAAFDGYFAMRMMDAGNASLERLEVNAQDYMWSTFMNPTGPLEDSLERQMFSPWMGHVATNMPYSRRRNWGFSGMTDSLGRFYPHDPGIEYMEQSIDISTPDIIGYYKTGIEQTILDLGGVP